MKNALRITLAVAVVGSLAWGATNYTRILNLYVIGKLAVGNATDSNAIDHMVVVDVDHDFASSTIVCTDSYAKTATGVKKGDPCFVGIGPRDGGTAIVTDNSIFQGIATADNEVKLRHCAVGSAADPADAGYVVRCISSP